MPDYYFQGLSPYDFEILVRDLLQAELGVRLESFSTGRDQGIDLRYSCGPSRMIVQCKHYPHSDWPALRRALVNEVLKVRQLNPTRYLVATSMGLSPERKYEIQQLFAPYCIDPSDVLGREDVNNLLGRHDTVERMHHKLWLTSVPVLSQVLNARIFSEQQTELESIRRRASRFVANPSLPRADQALREQKFVLISGVPGIGKTTLAEMLIIDHIARGYECFRLWEGIHEARDVLRRNERQVFYFDDFLGRTGLKHSLARNEDERLLRFIREVNHSEKTRLILTTREYILNQARSFMENLATNEIDVARCVVDLTDYTPLIRAEILYNHLYFSALPASHLDEILRTKAYRRIVRHPNYSPRILEAMTDAVNVRTIQASSYPAQFVEALDNPRRIWEVAFREHLRVEAQHALLVIATLPDRVRIADAERAFEAFHARRQERYGIVRSPYDWQRAIKEVEGTFLKHELSLGEILLEFHNPSVRDFLENHLRHHRADADDLLAAAIYSSQVKRMWEFLSRDASLPSDFLAVLIEVFWRLRSSESVVVERVVYYPDKEVWRIKRESIVRRFLILWDMSKEPSDLFSDHVIAASQDLRNEIDSGSERQELVSLLQSLSERTKTEWVADLFDMVLNLAYDFDGYTSLQEFSALADFDDEYGKFVPRTLHDKLYTAFVGTVKSEEEAIRDENDPELRLSWFDELSYVADKFGVTLSLSRDDLEDEVEPEYGDDDNRGWSRENSSGSGSLSISDEDLDSLFESLRDSSR